jgi:peroxiredoxin
MTKIASIFVLWLCSIFFTSVNQDHFLLKGLTSDIPSETMVFLVDGVSHERIDSTAIIDNKFEFKGNAHPYKEYWIETQYDGKFDYRHIYVENVDMVFDARGTNFQNAKITGSIIQEQSDELFDLLKPTLKELMEASQIPENTVELTTTENETPDYEKEMNRLSKQFIAEHPDYLISVKQLTYLKNHLPKSETKILFDALTEELKQTEDGQSIGFWLEKSVELAIGDKAPDFKLPNLKEKEVALSDFLGNYVLLEFGASGCYPCRVENPNLLKAYQTYQKDGFEIFSVWLDRNAKSWTSTVEKDEMIWTSVSDLKGNNGEVPTMYNVTSIPTYYLLNPKGEIIAMNLRGDALQTKLAEVFGK